MKQSVVKTMLCTLSIIAIVPMMAVSTSAKERIQTVNSADFKKDGYSIVLTEKNIVTGEEILDFQAPGFSVNETVIFYDAHVHEPKVSVVKNAGTKQERRVSEDCYTVVVPSGRKNIGQYTYKVTFKGELAGYGTVEKSFVIAPLNKVGEIKATSTKNKIRVSWTPIRTKYSNKFVAGYSVSYEKTDVLDNQDWKVFKKHKQISGKKAKSLTISGLKKNTSYGVMVRPYYKVNGRTLYGNWSRITYITTKK